MLKTHHILACTLLATALGCTQSFKPHMSTETGNPPVVIDSAKIALVVTRDEVHVQGKPGAVMPPEAEVEITILRTDDVTRAEVEDNGSFDAEVDATLSDVFEVRAVLGVHKSDVVIVVRGGAEVIRGDGGSLSCKQQTTLGEAILEGAYEAADRSCETAADCSEVWRGSACTSGCLAGYFSEQGRRTIADAIETVDEGVCASFEDDRCELVVPPCVAPLPAACIEGQCVEDIERGGACETCFSRDLTWITSGPGILPALPDRTSRTLTGCNTLESTDADGATCTSDVRCETAGTVSIAAVRSALAHEDVVQAFEQGGTHGYPENQSGFAYQLTLDGTTITYRTCAGMTAGVRCDPPNGLDELITLLQTLSSEHECQMPSPDPEADCTSAFEAGVCEAVISRWWHDPKTGTCLLRIYGGCGGNDNNYASEEECRAACPPPDDSSACPPNRVFVEDVCLQCGPAGGCAETSGACLLVCSQDTHCEGEAPSMNIEPTCSDTGVCVPQIICF